ncbi:hypothetical protein [Bacillus sp. REN3]|uniref:hypothetical protein n=1 Tax=Bacillus sp. REN3 TaxID=2802440 RepID=UPI0032C08ECE
MHLYRIPVDAKFTAGKVKAFYTIQTKDPDLFAITANHFKWSPDGNWVSFLAIPTASLAADSNLLYVITSKGEKFHVAGRMLGYDDWMKWASSANQLAFISGEGRFLVENKKTTILTIPLFMQKKEYTPNGYVDLDLEWYSPAKGIVARAKENKEWKEGTIPTMLTTLFAVDIKQKNKTNHFSGEG